MNKLIIAEDHPLIVKSMKVLLMNLDPSLTILHTDSCSELIQIVKTNHAEYVIADLNLTDGLSLNSIENLLSLYPSINILVYTAYPGELYAKRLLNMGVRCFLNKHADEDEVILALRKFLNKEFYVSQQILPFIISSKKTAQTAESQFNFLSQKELQVIEFLRTGESIKNIASNMGIMPNTVATYKKRAFEKLGIQNVVQLNHLYPGNS